MKGLHAMISALIAEVAALRKTVAEKPKNGQAVRGRRDVDVRRNDRIGVQHGRVEELK
jgi:hypothetical protein